MVEHGEFALDHDQSAGQRIDYGDVMAAFFGGLNEASRGVNEPRAGQDGNVHRSTLTQVSKRGKRRALDNALA